MTASDLRVLLVEDDPDDAEFFSTQLTEEQSQSFKIQWVKTLAGAAGELKGSAFDVILLDLSLPDSRGIETLQQLVSPAAGTPIVILTGLTDEAVAMKAVKEGAQDYLIKGRVDSSALFRAIRYAVERRRAENRVQAHRSEHEIDTLRQFSERAPSSISRDVLGIVPMKEAVPEVFERVVGLYSDMLELCVEKRFLKMQADPSSGLKNIADQLGSLGAGPRDAVDVHLAALKLKSDEKNPSKVQIIHQEARLLALELMGYLVAYYRNFSMGRLRSNTDLQQ